METKAQSRAWGKFIRAIHELTKSGAVDWDVSKDDAWRTRLDLLVAPRDTAGCVCGKPWKGSPFLAVTRHGEKGAYGWKFAGAKLRPLFRVVQRKAPRGAQQRGPTAAKDQLVRISAGSEQMYWFLKSCLPPGVGIMRLA